MYMYYLALHRESTIFCSYCIQAFKAMICHNNDCININMVTNE